MCYIIAPGLGVVFTRGGRPHRRIHGLRSMLFSAEIPHGTEKVNAMQFAHGSS